MGQGPDTPLAPLLAPMKIKALWWIAASGAAGILGCVPAGSTVIASFGSATTAA